jgi:hypothetical protein
MYAPRWRHRHLPESTHPGRGAKPSRYTGDPHPGGTTIPDEWLLPGEVKELGQVKELSELREPDRTWSTTLRRAVS